MYSTVEKRRRKRYSAKTDYFSGSHRAIDLVCVGLSVCSDNNF